jgi:hypothetical protein
LFRRVYEAHASEYAEPVDKLVVYNLIFRAYFYELFDSACFERQMPETTLLCVTAPPLTSCQCQCTQERLSGVHTKKGRNGAARVLSTDEGVVPVLRTKAMKNMQNTEIIK